MSRLCRVLLVSRSGYCQWRVRAPSARSLANQALDTKVAAIHQGSRRSYGRPRITQQLRQQGECVSAERVRQSLKRQGLHPVYRRAYVVTTDSGHRLPVAANILDRRFDGWQPNQAWVGDITYVATGEGWLPAPGAFDNITVRAAFLGVHGISPIAGIGMLSPEEAGMNRAFIEAAQIVNVIVDSSKFHSQAIFRIAQLDKVTRIITDEGVSDSIRTQLEQIGVEVMVASVEEHGQ